MLEDKQKPKELKTRLNILWELKILLYSMPDCSCGGPLHIILDDCNVRDIDIEFCRKIIDENKKHSYIKELCVCILDMLATLSPAQRLYWWQHQSIEDIEKVANQNIISTPYGYKIESDKYEYSSL